MKKILFLLLLLPCLLKGQDLKISQLPAAGTLNGTELAPIVQSGVTKQTTTAAIAALGGSGITGSGSGGQFALWSNTSVLTSDSDFTYNFGIGYFHLGLPSYGRFLDVNGFTNKLVLGDYYNTYGSNIKLTEDFYNGLYIFSGTELQIGTPKYMFPAANGITGRFLKDSLASGINYLKWATVSGGGGSDSGIAVLAPLTASRGASTVTLGVDTATGTVSNLVTQYQLANDVPLTDHQKLVRAEGKIAYWQ